MPFKSFEFESIDDHLRGDGLYSQYTRSSYPRRSSFSDTPLTSKAVDSPAMRKYNRDMQSVLNEKRDQMKIQTFRPHRANSHRNLGINDGFGSDTLQMARSRAIGNVQLRLGNHDRSTLIKFDNTTTKPVVSVKSRSELEGYGAEGRRGARGSWRRFGSSIGVTGKG
ncbi:hypothetical protein AVEN_133963-1 [Araneus ventricosus]|uniref:Uncharacterized protein n=1 Tax=Araneus ventricosus TaxID=182803 RepID=A0A4Y2J5B5_ARAVE|nr:hypothetical protein AVEN_133963-1 [Araneus ventricosus]